MIKKIFSIPATYFSLIAGIILLSASCTKTETNSINPETSSLGYVLANANNTTIFHSATVKAGLDSLFGSPSIFTLMVPTDQACTQSGYPQSVIDGFSADQARQWVLYQTYAGTALTFESFIGKQEVKLIMANGDSVFVSGDSNRTFVNGYQFVNSEITATNGVMLALGNVLTPPQKNLAQLVSSDSSLSFFNEAIQLATPVPDTLSVLLSTGGPYTLIAPINDAFRNLGYNSPADLATTSPDSLRSLVLLSLVPKRLFGYDVGDSTTVQTVSDSTLLFNITGILTTVQIQGDSVRSNIISSNTMGINGVLFKMDTLLH